MIKVNRQLLAQQRASNSVRANVPAPIGGWNTRDSLPTMDILDAVVLDNFFPQTGSVKSRRGTDDFATGFSGDVETIAQYDSGASQVRLAASGSDVYTWTSSKGGTATSIGSGFANARWQTGNITSNMIWVNGADTPQNFNGTTLVALTIVLKDGLGSVIVGTTAADMDGINIFKNRVYLWSSSENRFFVGDTNAIQGDFTEFPLDAFTTEGGALTAMGTITRDGGAGADDLAAFVMSTGQVLIYNGDDPNTAADWQLEGIYKIPTPISVRSVIKWKGDLKILTKADQISLLEVIGSGGLNVRPSKLSGAIKEAVQLHGGNYGFEAKVFPSEDMLIFNIPISTNNEYEQYVINTVTGAACRFIGINARTFATIDDELYIGENAKIMRYEGFDDAGADICVTGQGAFTDFNDAHNKAFLSIKDVIKSAAGINLAVSRALDFGIAGASSPQASTSTGTQWDVAQWDSFQWADESRAQFLRFAMTGTGIAISTKREVAITGDQIEWFRTDYSFRLTTVF